MTILIADGDEEFAYRMAQGIETKGTRCVTARSADQAISLFSQDLSISIGVVDIGLPMVGGLELARKLKLWARGRKFACLFVTAQASLESAIAALRSHAADLLQKPISVDELHASVKRAQAELDAEDSADRAPRADEDLRWLITARTERDKAFARHAMSDIAWHILLEIAYAETNRTQISVSSACIASGAPSATALRHLRTLEQEGLVKRIPDLADRRSTQLVLTDTGHERLATFLDRFSRRGLGPSSPQGTMLHLETRAIAG